MKPPRHVTPEQAVSLAARVRTLVEADKEGRAPAYWALCIGLDPDEARRVLAVYAEAEE